MIPLEIFKQVIDYKLQNRSASIRRISKAIGVQESTVTTVINKITYKSDNSEAEQLIMDNPGLLMKEYINMTGISYSSVRHILLKYSIPFEQSKRGRKFKNQTI